MTTDYRLLTPDYQRRLFLLLYACSGAAALMYEVTWTRLLTLQMGHTVAAASTVLAAFMGGLAVGAAIAGRIPFRTASARLRVYAALELAVAVSAAALPPLLAASVPALRWAYADGDAPMRFTAARTALSLILLGVPAAAMGATFPVAAVWFADTAADAGTLYAANTAGAAVGAIAAGFFLIPAIGMRGTTLIAVALNGVAAAGALWLARHAATTINAAAFAPEALRRAKELAETSIKKHPQRSLRPQRAPRSLRLPSSPQPVLASVAAAISGFAALVYEVAWTRLLALVIGPTTYAFATMTAAFITGLAIGSALGTHIARRSTHAAAWLGAMLMATAVGASAAAWYAATRLPLAIAAEVADPSAAWARLVLAQAVSVGILLLPTAIALGAAFPLALALASAGAETVRRDTARVYAFNTLGAIAGALTAGFVLLPAVGLQTTFRVTALAGLLAGAAIWIVGAASGEVSRDPKGQLSRDPKRVALHAERVALRSSGDPERVALRLVVPLGATVVLGIGILALPPWDRALLASGAYKYAPYMRGSDLETALKAGRLEYYKEGAAATVSVRRLAGTLTLSIDGKVDASNGGDMLTQRLLGLLPVLMHERPTDVCVIGLGSGVTLESTFATGTVTTADIVEISPEVVEASAFFRRENGNVLRAGGVRLVTDDGRSHLLLTRRQYDIIVSEPSNPWVAGVAALFTREFFEAARSRLKPDGLLCQWAHTYDMSADDLRSIVRTFTSVFPEGTMWLVGPGDLFLIGTNGAAIEPHLEGIARRLGLGSASALLADVSDPRAMAPGFQLFSLYAGGPRELRDYGDAAAIQRDDRMALEFSAPRSIYGVSSNTNSATLRVLADRATRPPAVSAVVDTATGVSWTARGLMELKAEAYGTAYDDLQRAVTTIHGNPAALEAALRGLSDAAAGAGRQNEERAWLQALAADQPSNAAARVELSRVLASNGEFDAAAAAAKEAIKLAPGDRLPVEQLGSVLADRGDAEQLGSLADSMLARFPGWDEALYFHATALFRKGQIAQAIEEARRFVAAHPEHAHAQNLLGAACATSGQRECALAAFEGALRANPRDPATYVNLGLLRLQAADPAAAASYFAEALTLDPTSTDARTGLAQSRAALGRP